MTLMAVQGGLWIPGRWHSSVAGVILASLTIDAAAEKVAHIFQAPKTGTLDTFEVGLAASGQHPANGLKFSFQDVDLATGDPDGIADQFRVKTGIGAGWTVPGLITSDGTDSGTKRSVTRGDLLAAVVEFASFSAGDVTNVQVGTSNANDQIGQRTFTDHFTAAWSKVTNPINLALKYSDGSYAFIGGGAQAASALNTTTFNSGSATNEIALYFKFPSAVKVGGAWIRVGVAGVSSDVNVVLYDSDGVTSLATVSVDGNTIASTGNARTSFVMFPSDVTILAETFYRLAIKPTTANNISLSDLQTATAAIMDSHEGGQNFYYSAKTSGVWAETTTRRPLMGLLVTALDSPTVYVAQSTDLALPAPLNLELP